MDLYNFDLAPTFPASNWYVLSDVYANPFLFLQTIFHVTDMFGLETLKN